MCPNDTQGATALCCPLMRDLASRSRLMEHFSVTRQYDPRPKNQDGSVRWFLYRWDDGKSGMRKLVRCRHCGSLFLVQAYRVNKFSPSAAVWFEDWYPVKSETEADQINRTFTGPQWELRHKPVLRCADDQITQLR